jgi:outer membrane lipoprotein-sorting protein
MRKRFVLVAPFVLVAISASSEYPQDARQILTKVSDSYANLKTYDFKMLATGTTELGSAKYRLVIPLEMAQGDTPDEAMTVVAKAGKFY